MYRSAIGVLLTMAISATLAWGQTTGSVTGTVTDSSGAAMGGVSMTITNPGAGINQSGISNELGFFQFLLLPPGTYTVEATFPGFQAFRRVGIVVEGNRSQSVPVVLAIGQMSETIEVSAGAILLEANTSDLGTVMDRKKIEDLPLTSRNPMALANLIPTVKGLSLFGGQIMESTRSGAISIGGGAPISNGFLIDGVQNDKIGDAVGAMTFLVADATQEFKVLSNAFSAEYGGTGGGVVSVVSRSGTNEFHGALSHYLRNTLLKANDFFANASGLPRPIVNINQYAGSVGGPIKKDKLFFFYNYEGYKERRTFNRLNTAPTALQRAGDFSQTRAANGSLITIYDPLTTRPDPASPGAFIRSPFPGNVIPPERQTKLSREIFKLYPMPNLPGDPVTGINNLAQTGRQATNRYNTGIKLDYNLSDTRRLAFRYTRDMVSWTYPNYYNSILENEGRQPQIPRHSASLLYTHTLSPTLLLDAKAGYNRDGERGVGPFQQEYGEGIDMVELGYPASFVSQIPVGKFVPRGSLPGLTITDLVTAAGYTNLLSGSTQYYRTAANPGANAALTKITGPHTLKTGYQWVFYSFNTANSPGGAGFSFNRGFTQGPNPNVSSSGAGFGMASFMLGTVASSSFNFSPQNTYGRHFHAMFVQDDWKLSRDLTLNLGLRYELENALTDRFNVFNNIDLDIPSPLQVPGMNLKGGAVYPATGGDRSIWNTPYNHFGPRVGFAYQITSKIVSRGGYGISWIPSKGTIGVGASGFSSSNPMITSIDGGLTPYNTINNPYPDPLTRPSGSTLGAMTNVGASLSGLKRDFRPGYSQQWNFTIQTQPWNNWLFETAYLGNRGIRLFTSQNINYNQLHPDYLALGNQLLQTVPNPFFGIIPTGPLSTRTVTRQQLLRPYPQFTDINGSFGSLGDSNYHALALKVDKRFSQGFSILVAYTKSKLIDAAQGNAGSSRNAAGGFVASNAQTPIQNWYNLRAERSKGVEDIPQRLVITGLWEMPFARNTQGWARQVFHGWQINGIVTLQSGHTLSIFSGASGGAQTMSGKRPNVVPGVNPKLEKPTLQKWFNTAAFSVPGPFEFGNASRTIPNVHGPGIRNVDASLLKTFPLVGEQYKLQFRMEAFNLFNTPMFHVPGLDVNTTSFGVVSATTGPLASREFQASLRLTF